MKKYTILVSFMNAVGHANACLGAVLPLLQRGHRIVVVLESAFKGKAAALGFEEFVYQIKCDEEKFSENKLGKNPGEALANLLLEKKILGPSTCYEKFENITQVFQSDAITLEFAKQNEAVCEAIEKYKPDLIYYDSPRLVPVIYYSNIPVIRNISAVPSYYELDDELPPGGFGLPIDSDKKLWKEINQKRRFLYESSFFQTNQVEPLGYKAYPENNIFPEISCMTVYAYPEELNYPSIRERNWFNLEVFNKFDSAKTEELSKLIPEDFLTNTLNGKFSGKLIYLSMGSMGSMDLSLMNRLVEVLGSTPHKYIVSKGPRHAEYSLASNMYGDRYLPQVKLIPHADLVITHGGNNTVTEVFAQGKPMIVLPLFSDQFENAQRLHETGFGVRLDTYGFEGQELIGAINKLLYDQELKLKLRAASERIQASNRHEELADKIEDLLSKC